MNYYEYFYFKINRYLLSNTSLSTHNIWSRGGPVFLISIIEEMPLFVLISILLSQISFNISTTVLNYGLLILLCVINGIYFLKNDRWKEIIDKYNGLDGTNISTFMNIFIMILIIAGFFSVTFWKVIVDWKLF